MLFWIAWKSMDPKRLWDQTWNFQVSILKNTTIYSILNLIFFLIKKYFFPLYIKVKPLCTIHCSMFAITHLLTHYNVLCTTLTLSVIPAVLFHTKA